MRTVQAFVFLSICFLFTSFLLLFSCNFYYLDFFLFLLSVDSHTSVGPIELLKPQINSPTTLGARITGLKRDHSFRFYVWARTGAGKGPHSVVDVKTVHAYRKYKFEIFSSKTITFLLLRI